MRNLVMKELILVGLIAASSVSAQGRSPPQGVMIFFDWGKSEIQRHYTGVLDTAAAAYVQGEGGTVRVEGHSDRSGSSASNRQSSRLRAQAVRDYLVGRGLPSAVIEISAAGEEQSYIATADGVREPQNRRVDVRFAPALAVQ